jgi:hypothetical protein
VLEVLGWARAIGGSKRAVSPVVSAVIITATLLTIIVVATALASSTLETHLQNLEFEQAKTMMMALGKVIAEVSLRPGAASSVQFNQRSGGIGGLPRGGPDYTRVQRLRARPGTRQRDLRREVPRR